ncbi:methyl-accepting chemotaxis protein [Paenibacillus sp. MMS18-CY102]|uniref:methyl-accepting chemotaxis protein n=1 Tax=Paenibacillus sp. MMS18-CY102 TaxID=2682849 RepID=UPI0013654544|nr:methyl-accepting chemotaxis protein [Paenibacillus sp. MMS18-CY102]MWC28566.1 hypothetical protein [Paenibacillus sp. MMS18-CY102]
MVLNMKKRPEEATKENISSKVTPSDPYASEAGKTSPMDLREISLRHYTRTCTTVKADMTCLAMLQAFKRNVAAECAVVVEQGKPIGLIMRNRFYMHLSQRFGAELYYDKPVTKLMDSSPLVAQVGMPPSVLIGEALGRDEATLYDCVIVTENGVVNGVLTVGDLLRLSRDVQEEAVRRQSATLREARELMAAIDQAIAEVKVSTSEGERMSGEMVEMTLQGKTELNQVKGAFERLIGQTQEQAAQFAELQDVANDVGDVTVLIRDMAEQSNLLAVNAAIEAARAGEHGKGFAVVADHMRLMATETKRSADRIAGLVQGIQGAIKQTAELTGQSQLETSKSSELVLSASAAFERLFRSAVHNSESSRQVAALSDQAYVRSASVQERMSALAGAMKSNG